MNKETGLPLMEGSQAVLTVTELNRIIKGTLERELDAVWVVGEISNFRVPPSGHFYFTLKDDSCQLAAVAFRGQVQGLGFQPENGMQVLCFGRVGLYPVRGDLQLYVETMEPRGQGALFLAFEQLKKRLWEEGLFDEERKRPLPYLPRSIGIVTSPRGAVLHDMLRILGDRFPKRRIVIRPVRVQGDGAAREIAEGIKEIGESGVVEVVIVGRGGGSLEDLWAFNEESVARAIYASPVPVISAVGHEVDYTISDFVADHRAPTPTAAAEMVVPRVRDLATQISGLDARLLRGVQGALSINRERWERLGRRLADPTRRLREDQLRVDDLSLSLVRRFQNALERFRDRLAPVAGRLGSLSPLAVLERGYSIAYKLPEGFIVKESGAVKRGDLVRITFARGRSLCKVESSE